MSPRCCNAVLREKSLSRIVTSPLVTYHSMFDICLHSRGERGPAVVMVNDPFSDLPFFGSEESMLMKRKPPVLI